MNAQEVKEAYRNLLGWRQHYDTNKIELPSTFTVSESGEYYQQKHPALNLEYIYNCLPPNQTIDTYLTNTVDDSIVEVFNDLNQYTLVNQYSKTLLQKSMLLNRVGYLNDTVANLGRFVGYQITLKSSTGLRTVINEIGLQFTSAETFKLYLFHTSKVDPIQTIDVVTTGSGSWNWQNVEMELFSYKNSDYNGGAFVLGYYQDDLTGTAVNLNNFDWNRGECGGCNRNKRTDWNAIRKYVHVFPLYVPAGGYEVGKMFDIANDAIFSKSESYGLNMRLTVDCDLTEFYIENKMVFKNLLSLKVTHKVLQTLKYSMETNHIEEDIKMMIIRDLEGDTETNAVNIPTSYKRELKAVHFNTSDINAECLPCESAGTAPNVGVA